MEEVFWPLAKHKRNCNHHHSATITDIPDALLIDIFLRLPLKSAKQCSLVSKHWYALISSPDFAHRFLNFSSKLLIYYTDNKGIRRHFMNPETSAISIFDSFSFAFLPAVAKPVAFCKDLVLCCSTMESESFYYICNPFTRTWIQLPPSPAPHFKWVRHGFLFEGSGCSFKYTLVRIPYNEWEFHKVQIFSSDSGIWSEKLLNHSPISSRFPLFLNSNGVEYHGMLFWIGEDGLLGIDPSENGECNIRVIDLPPNVSKAYNMSLAVCKESLRLMELKIDLGRDVDVVSICVWDLMDFEKVKWSLKRETSYSGLFQSKSTTWFKEIELINWLACEPNGDIVYLQMGSSTVVSCNLHKKTMDVVCQIKFDPWIDIFAARFGFCGAFIYELHWQPTSIRSPRLQCRPHEESKKQNKKYFCVPGNCPSF